MNDSCRIGKSGDRRAAVAAVMSDSTTRASARLYDIKSAVSRRSSYVTISVDAAGHLNYDSEVDPEHAERMVDALLLMLVKARQASA
jgi:hypothetical protein